MFNTWITWSGLVLFSTIACSVLGAIMLLLGVSSTLTLANACLWRLFLRPLGLLQVKLFPTQEILYVDGQAKCTPAVKRREHDNISQIDAVVDGRKHDLPPGCWSEDNHSPPHKERDHIEVEGVELKFTAHGIPVVSVGRSSIFDEHAAGLLQIVSGSISKAASLYEYVSDDIPDPDLDHDKVVAKMAVTGFEHVRAVGVGTKRSIMIALFLAMISHGAMSFDRLMQEVRAMEPALEAPCRCLVEALLCSSGQSGDNRRLPATIGVRSKAQATKTVGRCPSEGRGVACSTVPQVPSMQKSKPSCIRGSAGLETKQQTTFHWTAEDGLGRPMKFARLRTFNEVHEEESRAKGPLRARLRSKDQMEFEP